MRDALYRFALWAETPVPHAIISFTLIASMFWLLLARGMV